ncbi:hypothetical protein V757_03065 [Pelistega indica]|uniref:Uncharacterized protein n=1 Tax=Pelistega indica TaxID=1414851 RepID=V8G8B5_9BURK|nr:hypothetical protein V757_03065 [Pelistega indica]
MLVFYAESMHVEGEIAGMRGKDGVDFLKFTIYSAN